MANRSYSDETYVMDLCDRILGVRALRQHRFDFLRGDPGKSGSRARLPVDAFYPSLGLAIEYHEKQHTEAVAHFDKPDRLTVSGVHRGEQRRIYDGRRHLELPLNGITLVVLRYDQLAHSKSGRLNRDGEHDRGAIRTALAASNVVVAES